MVLGNLTSDPHDYRESVSPWFRSIFYFQPQPELMAAAPLGFQPHALAAWVLFAFWPFSRLVHVFSMPLGYLTRPYIVYRSRDTDLGSHDRDWILDSSHLTAIPPQRHGLTVTLRDATVAGAGRD